MIALDDWPGAHLSRQVRCRPHDWHVQDSVTPGPTILLLHGTGGATHSWRDVLPALAATARVVAVDLPGHGRTRLGSRHRSGLEHMVADLDALCSDQGWAPDLIVGHSAGAAIALRLAARHRVPMVGINPALAPFRGLAGTLFPVAARLMALAPGVVDMVHRNTRSPGRVAQLLRSTGSDIDARGQTYYARLFADRDHIDGVLMMMAQWKLDGLLADLPQIAVPSLFLTGGDDRTVPPDTAVTAAARMPDARVETYDGAGHLLHEERPVAIAARIAKVLSVAA